MILTYHEIVPGTATYVYSIGRGDLDDHLGLGLPVTFDDGHRSQHLHGLPLLQKYGRVARFFVTTGWTGVRRDHMDWRQLAELVAEGHQVQSHGWSHKLLTLCEDAELANELQRSRAVLEDRLGVEVRSLSLPGGRGDARVWRACATAGYTSIFTSDPWVTAHLRLGVATEGRLMVCRTMTRHCIERMQAAENEPWNSMRLRHGAKTLVRKAVGDRLYLRLWRYWGNSTNQQPIDREYGEHGA